MPASLLSVIKSPRQRATVDRRFGRHCPTLICMNTPYGVPPQQDPQSGPGQGDNQPAGYPAPPPQGYYPPPLPRKSRTGLWVSLVVALFVVVAVSVGSAAYLFTRKPDITALTSSMVLPESEFPETTGSLYTRDPLENDAEWKPAKVDPAMCWPLISLPRPTQKVGASSLDADGSGYSVTLQLDETQPDMTAALAECDGLKIDHDGILRTVRGARVNGIPDWAAAARIEQDDNFGFTFVSGYYRGVLVDITHYGTPGDADADELARMFNSQVERLSEQ